MSSSGRPKGTKPKFVPKVPIKKEPSAAPPEALPPAATGEHGATSTGGKKGDGNIVSPQSKRANQGTSSSEMKQRRRRGGQSHHHKDQQQHRQKHRWVMPTGATFFTGGASGNTSLNMTAAGGGSRSINADAATSSGLKRVARPNEIIEELPAAGTAKVKLEPGLASNRIVPASSLSGARTTPVLGGSSNAMEVESVDSDSDGNDDRLLYDGTGDADEQLEKWPPAKFEPLNPVSLPIGPSTALMRNILTTQPMLADPSDEEGLIEEESSSLFLIQMPTDLRFDKLKAVEENSHHAAAEGMEVDEAHERDRNRREERTGNNVNTRREPIGKLQLLQSGKLRLVTTAGKTYEINSGVATTFVQILAAVDVSNDAEQQTSETSVPSDAAVNIKADPDASTAPDVDAARETSGTVHFMGSITKKLVITPDYEIGERRRRSFSTTSINSQQRIDGIFSSSGGMDVEDSLQGRDGQRLLSSTGEHSVLQGSYRSGAHVHFMSSSNDSSGRKIASAASEVDSISHEPS